MKIIVLIGIFTVLTGFPGVCIADPVTYFYEELGCTKTDGSVSYECPDFRIRNESCQFKKFNFKVGEEITLDLLKGSCQHCSCSQGGHIVCADEDCRDKFNTTCSHFLYTLDRCCPVGVDCDESKIECEIDGEKYKDGMRVDTKDSCKICLCAKGFKMEAPFCQHLSCFDQLTNELEVSNFGAPVFLKGENCCPDAWVPVKDDKTIIKINATAPADFGESCKYGEKKVALGYGFKTSVDQDKRVVQLMCECTTPPYVICKEQ